MQSLKLTHTFQYWRFESPVGESNKKFVVNLKDHSQEPPPSIVQAGRFGSRTGRMSEWLLEIHLQAISKPLMSKAFLAGWE